MTAVLGSRQLRREDPALLTGEARFVDDLQIPGALSVRIVRSPVAHAKIASIDTSAAAAVPGVVAVLTGPDFRDDVREPIAVRVAGHRRHEEPRALAAGDRHGELRG